MKSRSISLYKGRGDSHRPCREARRGVSPFEKPFPPSFGTGRGTKWIGLLTLTSQVKAANFYRMKTNTDGAVFAFRWKYVLLPIVLLLLSLFLVTIFYGRLPFPAAYRFNPDGSPNSWAIPGLFAFWALLPQFVLTLGAIVVTWAVSKLATRFLDPANAIISPKRIMLLTGNMVALPQIILVFAMLDIFIYNSYQTHFGPSVWVFALIVMVIGGIILGSFFLQMVRLVLAANKIHTKP